MIKVDRSNFLVYQPDNDSESSKYLEVSKKLILIIASFLDNSSFTKFSSCSKRLRTFTAEAKTERLKKVPIPSSKINAALPQAPVISSPPSRAHKAPQKPLTTSDKKETLIVKAHSASAILKHLCAIKMQKEPFCSTIEWNDQMIQFEIPYGHVLYEKIFDIFLLTKFNEEKGIDGQKLTQIVYQQVGLIVEELKKAKKLNLNDIEEERRWTFTLGSIGYCACQAYTCQTIDDVKPFALRALEVCRLLKPFVKSNHKYLLHCMNQFKFDVAVLMGSYYCQKHEFDDAEGYYNSSLRFLQLRHDHKCYKSAMYCVLNGLSEIHFRRGDLLEAEVQYDYCTRFISKKTVLSHPSNPKSLKIYILHHELGNRYQREKKWEDEKRLRTKAVEVCESFKKHSKLYRLSPLVAKEIDKIISNSRYRLNCIGFFKEMPQKLTQKFEGIDENLMTLKTKDSTVYQKVFPLLLSEKILRVAECSEKSLVLKIIMTSECHVLSLFRKLETALYPQPKKKAVKIVAQPIPKISPSENLEKERNLAPLPHIPENWKEKQKQNTARKQRGNRPKVNKTEIRSHFKIEQQNPIPQKACWIDKKWGELVFERDQPECQVIVMRNEHNCGKPAFGHLPAHLFTHLLRKYYSESEAQAILTEMKQSFSEAKQAGFFGRGIKSCPHLPLLNGTDYKIELKPSSSFKPIFRVFGRHIKNESNTLFIFDAIDRNPKSAASKLEIL